MDLVLPANCHPEIYLHISPWDSFHCSSVLDFCSLDLFSFSSPPPLTGCKHSRSWVGDPEKGGAVSGFGKLNPLFKFYVSSLLSTLPNYLWPQGLSSSVQQEVAREGILAPTLPGDRRDLWARQSLYIRLSTYLFPAHSSASNTPGTFSNWCFSVSATMSLQLVVFSFGKRDFSFPFSVLPN